MNYLIHYKVREISKGKNKLTKIKSSEMKTP